MFEKVKIKHLIKKNRKKYQAYYDELKKSDKYLYIKRKSDFKFLYLAPKYRGIALGIQHKLDFYIKICYN